MAPPKYGIYEVYRPPSGMDAEVDIVAIHGLTGGALSTWTAKKNGICWLQHPDFLPGYISNARVLVWGYNASISSLNGITPSSNRIHNHAHTLVAELCADRKLEKRMDKPIIFLCHSLGGIIVKRALAYSSSRQDSAKLQHLHSFYTCTYGILFFGTPHRGSSQASMLNSYLKMASIATPKRIVQFDTELTKALKMESETLQNITDSFVPMMKNFAIFFFWEQEKTDLGYTKQYIVEKESAVPDVDDTEKSGIPATHSEMCKFDDKESSSFRLVMAALEEYCEKAPEAIRAHLEHARIKLDFYLHEQAKEKIRQMQDIQSQQRSQLVPRTASSQAPGMIEANPGTHSVSSVKFSENLRR